MKARPRSVENRVAELVNDQLIPLGCSPVERIPVIGRTGPDLSVNEMNLIVDVKSRIEVPKSLFFPLLCPFHFDDMLAVRLTYLPLLWSEGWVQPAPLEFSSKIVRGYLEHMEEWTRERHPEGVSCVILHRPEMPIGSCVAIIHSTNRRRLIEYAKQCYTPNSISHIPA
jgi:hypothetical protein